MESKSTSCCLRWPFQIENGKYHVFLWPFRRTIIWYKQADFDEGGSFVLEDGQFIQAEEWPSQNVIISQLLHWESIAN